MPDSKLGLNAVSALRRAHSLTTEPVVYLDIGDGIPYAPTH